MMKCRRSGFGETEKNLLKKIKIKGFKDGKHYNTNNKEIHGCEFLLWNSNI
jgi:hypothetical protein